MRRSSCLAAVMLLPIAGLADSGPAVQDNRAAKALEQRLTDVRGSAQEVIVDVELHRVLPPSPDGKVKPNLPDICGSLPPAGKAGEIREEDQSRCIEGLMIRKDNIQLHQKYLAAQEIVQTMMNGTISIDFAEGLAGVYLEFDRNTNIWSDKDFRNAWDYVRIWGTVAGLAGGALAVATAAAIPFINSLEGIDEQNKQYLVGGLAALAVAVGAAGLGGAALSQTLGFFLGQETGQNVGIFIGQKIEALDLSRYAYDEMMEHRAQILVFNERNKSLYDAMAELSRKDAEWRADLGEQVRPDMKATLTKEEMCLYVDTASHELEFIRSAVVFVDEYAETQKQVPLLLERFIAFSDQISSKIVNRPNKSRADDVKAFENRLKDRLDSSRQAAVQLNRRYNGELLHRIRAAASLKSLLIVPEPPADPRQQGLCPAQLRAK